MLTPGHIILSIPISFDWIVVCAAVQTSTQPPYITHQGCASHQHWLLFNSIFNHLLLLQHHTLADRCYSTVLQYLQQLLSLSWVIIKADHYFLSDYTALIHCRSTQIASRCDSYSSLYCSKLKSMFWSDPSSEYSSSVFLCYRNIIIDTQSIVWTLTAEATSATNG